MTPDDKRIRMQPLAAPCAHEGLHHPGDLCRRNPRSRFGIAEKLVPYSSEEIGQIVTRSAARLGCELDDGAAQRLSERARGVLL